MQNTDFRINMLHCVVRPWLHYIDQPANYYQYCMASKKTRAKVARA